MLFQSATLENTEIIFCRQSPSRLLVWYVCNRTLVTTVLQCVYHVMESLYCSCYKSYIWKSKKKKSQLCTSHHISVKGMVPCASVLCRDVSAAELRY